MSNHTTPTVQVVGLDHLVIRCRDVDASLAFYVELLGLEPLRLEEFRAGTVPFPSVRVDATTIIDLFPTTAALDRAQRNLDHYCLVIAPAGLAELAASERFTVVSGPDDHLYGAQGYATSLYVADPDGNTVELRCYPPEAAAGS